MKILLISAGTKDNGATKRCMLEAKMEIERLGQSCECFNLRSEAIASCSGCNACKSCGRCKHKDSVTELSDKISDFDGYIFFTPVHYGGCAGVMKSALSRLFYSKKSGLLFKPASAVAVSRRGGNVTALEEISRFFTFASMPYVSGNYPGIVHGSSTEEAEKDEEGLQTVRSIASNLVWLIKSISLARLSGILPSFNEQKLKTDFIR